MAPTVPTSKVNPVVIIGVLVAVVVIVVVVVMFMKPNATPAVQAAPMQAAPVQAPGPKPTDTTPAFKNAMQNSGDELLQTVVAKYW